ncbi:MAG: surface-adhesin E family protein [Micropepsaceae bacterium]
MSSLRLNCALALCATLAACQLAAADTKERWLVAKASGGSLAYDTETIKRDEKTGYVTLLSALYLSKPEKSASGKVYQYILSEDRLNCSSKTFQPMTRVLLDGTPTVVDEFELEAPAWQPVSENQSLAFFLSIVCNGDALGNSREASSIEAALTLMQTMAK